VQLSNLSCVCHHLASSPAPRGDGQGGQLKGLNTAAFHFRLLDLQGTPSACRAKTSEEILAGADGRGGLGNISIKGSPRFLFSFSHQ
jgi:hypothetical protein